uniref:MADS-box protein 2 n=1 Tax=Cunninghamia lanceolata TaxID=28977 RepID=A0A8F2Z0D5_CUNLA|nr:MADS-box protein 2 [Cunninghamia lanceolata]
MGRGKIEIKKIENTTNRNVTFCKRRNGLMKKAFELSVLCDAEVAVIVFNNRGKLYEYSSKECSLHKTIQRYRKTTIDSSDRGAITEVNTRNWEEEVAKLRQDIELLDITNKNLVGERIENMNQKQLKNLEHKIDKAFSKVRKRKEEVMCEKIALGRRNEDMLKQENDEIRSWIMERECYQRTNMLLSQPEYNALPAYASQNFVHGNLITTANHFARQEQTTLQLG